MPRRNAKVPPKKAIDPKAFAALSRRGGHRRKVSLETPPIDGQWTYGHIQLLAGLTYVGDSGGLTIEEMHKRAPFSAVNLETLYGWSKQDRWVERRAEFLAKVQASVLTAKRQEVVAAQLRVLDDTETIYQKTLTRLQGNDPDCPLLVTKSYEALLGAFCRLVGVMHEVRRDIVNTPLREGLVEGSVQAADDRLMPELSPEEARVAALAVVRHRMGMPQTDPEDAGKDPQGS